MSYLYQNSINPFSWNEAQAGVRYLQKEKLTIPEYKVILGQLPSCSDIRCYLHKLNLLPGYDTATFVSFTVPLIPDLLDAFICPNHLLPRDPHHLLANSSHEIDYFYAAVSLVKLQSYNFDFPSEGVVEKKPLANKIRGINAFQRIDEFRKMIKNVAVSKYSNIVDKERIDLVEKATRGACSTLRELKSLLAYLLEVQERSNKEGFENLSKVINETFNLYGVFNIYYRSFKTEPVPIEDFALLNKSFNQLVSSLFSDLDEELKKEHGFGEISTIFQLLQRNYQNVINSFTELGAESDEVIISLKAEPNQNNLFNQFYSRLGPAYIYIFLQNNLFPKNKVLFKQERDSIGLSKALYKISFEEYINLFLFYDGILDSDIYFKKDESKVLDATILWSKDHNSPLYPFDQAYDITSKI